MASALFDVITGLQLTDNRGFFSANGNVIVNALTTSSGLYWTGNGKSISGIAITASTNPPTSPPPSIGDQWYNTSNDVVYQYQFDGTSSYWVDISSTVITANSSVSAIDTVITDSIKANVGAYQIYANNRLGTLDANLGTATTNISNLVTQANANVAAYLPTHTGNISAGNITVGNLNVTGEITGTAWTAYTPVWTASGTAPSIGDGSITGAYKQIGKTVFVRVRLQIGSTTTTGTGNWRISLPVAAADANGVLMPATYLDNGVSWYIGLVNSEYDGDTGYVVPLLGSTPSGAVTATQPFTWASGDSLVFNGTYEAA